MEQTQGAPKYSVGNVGVGVEINKAPVRNLEEADAVKAVVVPEPVPVSEINPVGIQINRAQGVAEQAQRAKDSEIGILDKLNAMTDLWDTSKLADAALRQYYPEVVGYTASEFVQGLDDTFSEDEIKYLYKANSPQESEYRYDRIKRDREASRIAGMNPVAATVIGFIDPAYLLVDMFSVGAGRAVRSTRMATGAAAGLGAGAIMAGVSGERPISQLELMVNTIGNAGVSAALAKPLTTATKTATSIGRNAAGAGKAAARDDARQGMEWSLYKTMSEYSDVGKEVAETILADPVNQNTRGAANTLREVSSRIGLDLSHYQRYSMARQGTGAVPTLKRLLNPNKHAREQLAFDAKVHDEIMYRTQNPNYRGTDPEVAHGADLVTGYTQKMAKELEARGIVDPGFADANPNYVPRRGLDGMFRRVEGEIGRDALRGSISASIRKVAPHISEEYAGAMAESMIHRATDRAGTGGRVQVANEARADLRQFIINTGADEGEVATMLQKLGVDPQAADPLGNLNKRIPLDMTMPIEGTDIRIMDLFDKDLNTLLEGYHRRTSGRIAADSAGLKTESDWEALRKRLSESIGDSQKRREAEEMFDDLRKSIRGEATGERLPDGMRILSNLSTATSLASGGFWQIVEYGTAMHRQGAVATLQAALKSMPEARKMFKELKEISHGKNPQEAWDLEEVLTAQLMNDIRLKPVVQHYDDMFQAQKGKWMMFSETARDVTPYVNMQKYVHGHHARTVAQLSVQTLRKAALGDAKALKNLARYDIEPGTLKRLRENFEKHGTTSEGIQQWSNRDMGDLNNVLLRMADDAIVQAKLGEIPAFAQFTSTGKFLFKFRSFVLGAHNKTMLSTAKDGHKAMAMLLAYQLPLSVLAVTAQSAARGEPVESVEEAVTKAIGYLSGLGLMTEAFNVIFGTSREVGAPGLAAADNMYGLISSAKNNGASGKTAAAFINAVPVAAVLPGTKLLTNQFKED